MVTKKLNKTLFFTHKVFKHISETLVSLISILQAVKSVIKNTGKKPGPNTEIYGPRSEYGFLRTARQPIRMQDSSKPYNNNEYSFRSNNYKLALLKPKINFLKRSFSYRTAQEWNELPNSINENVDEIYLAAYSGEYNFCYFHNYRIMYVYSIV